jgi:DNA-binding CsgD family transcriptional regulator
MTTPQVTVLIRYQDDGVTSGVASALGITSDTLSDIAIVVSGPAREIAELIERLPAVNVRTGAAPVSTLWAYLTERERVVASLAGQGLTDQQIANRLDITSNTVDSHLRRIYRKLKIHSRVCLAKLMPEGSEPPGGDRVGRP